MPSAGLRPVATQLRHRSDSSCPSATTPGPRGGLLAAKCALEGERKQVTVLFVDLKGSMELLADRDPEDARKVLDLRDNRLMPADESN